MHKDDMRAILFALVVCVVVSLVLSATATSLREKQNFNKEIDRKKNVLRAFGVQVEKKGKVLSPEKINKYFETNIREVLINDQYELEKKTREDYKDQKLVDNGKAFPLPLYIWSEDGQDSMYAYKQYGMGLWSTVNSYIALNKDLATIKGATFFDHGETPGLGGECSKPWFQKQWENKIIYRDGEPVDFKVAKGKAKSETEVDGMSGATITGNGIAKFTNEFFGRYNNYFEKIRGK